MPRPARARVAARRAAAPEAAAKSSTPEPQPAAAASAAKSKPEHPGGSGSSDIYDVSDREKQNSTQRRRSGRVAATTQQVKALDSARRQRDAAMGRLDNMTSTTGDDSAAPEQDETVPDTQENRVSDASPELGRKTAATPLHGRMADVSGLDLDDTMFDDINTTFDTTTTTATATTGTGSALRSHNNSTISASHFKRRPRAGSFLSRDDGPIRPSSRAGPNTPGISSTFNIGVFKRRAREPSILGTAQKDRAARPEPESADEMDNDDDDDDDLADEDDFAPEAESTPFQNAKRRSAKLQPGDGSPRQPSSDRPASRKRKSQAAHEQRQRSSPRADPVAHVTIPSTEEPAEEQHEASPLPPSRVQSSRPVTPVRGAVDESLMAPPLSSDASGDEEMWPPIKALAQARAKRPAGAVLRRTPVRDNGDSSDMSSPPSLTHSPNYAESPPPPPPKMPTRQASKRTAAAAAAAAASAASATSAAPAAEKEEKKMTTAELASLLPRRRQKAGDAREEDGSDTEVEAGGEDDDDELRLDVRSRPRRPGTRAAAATTAPRSTGNKKPPPKAQDLPAVKGMATRSKGRRITRTYGRSSDKENENEEEEEEENEETNESFAPVADDTFADEGETAEGGDGDTTPRPRARGEELNKAVHKFKEVDRWELEFEEMTQSSSPVPE